MRLENDLKPHNKETYEKVKSILQTNNKTCIIQPTGSGKSYIILKLIEDYAEQGRDIIVIEPRKYIFEQLQKKMNKYGLVGNHVKFLTYSALGKMNAEKIKQFNYPKMVIVDEMHSAGAPKWGLGLQMMFNSFPNDCKYIGLSATPIRYLDKRRNMAEELFDGCIANEISLADAILNRILPLPRYIAGLYTYENEVNTIIGKIQSSHNTYQEKKKLLEEVAVLKRNLDKSKGVSTIFKKYIDRDKGKYIAFCQNIEHLKLMKSCLEQWYFEAGISINFYEVHCENPEKDDQFNAFMDDTGLSVCLSVAMLSEGVHGINGVILLRDTISPNLYYQQIGRVFAVDMDTIPIIFDLVANCESIMECNLKNDLLEAVEKRDSKKMTKKNSMDKNDNAKENEVEITKEIIEEFFVFDQVIDAINAFKNIELICKQNDFWTDEDKIFLTENYGLLSIQKIAKKLSKSQTAVEHMRKKLKLRNLYRFWSEGEIEILKKYYALEGEKVANRLPYKTEKQCERKARKLKINYSGCKTQKYKYVHWSKYDQKWKVYFIANGKFINLGFFDSEDEAGRVAMEKAREYGKI